MPSKRLTEAPRLPNNRSLVSSPEFFGRWSNNRFPMRHGNLLKGFLVGIFLTSLVLKVPVVLAEYGLEETATAAQIPMTKTLTVLVGDIVGNALSLVSVVFFGLMLYAGLKWMLARGDSGEADTAKETIIAAIIGLVVILASYALTNFVFKSVGGTAGGAETGGTTSGVTIKTCAEFGSGGYACRAKTSCGSDDIIKSQVAEDFLANKSKIPATWSVSSEGYYLQNACPGSATNVCCIKL